MSLLAALVPMKFNRSSPFRLLLIVCLAVDSSPVAKPAFTDLWDHVQPAFLEQAISPEPSASRFSPLLKVSSRFSTLRSAGQAFLEWMKGAVPSPLGVSPAGGRMEIPLHEPIPASDMGANTGDSDESHNPSVPHGLDLGDEDEKVLDAAYQQYRQEVRRHHALWDSMVAENKDFLIPETSLAPKIAAARQGKGTLPYLGVFGVLPPQVMDHLKDMQRRLRDHVADVVREQVDASVFQEEYQDLMSELIFLAPDTIHLTVAGIPFNPGGVRERIRIWIARLRAVRRTHQIAEFRRVISMKYDGELTFFSGWTACYAVVIEPDSALDLSRFSTLITSYGQQLRMTRIAHTTLVYLLGKYDPHIKRWKMSARHVRLITEATRRLEEEEKNTVMESSINGLAVKFSKTFDDTRKVPTIPFLEPARYTELIQSGKLILALEQGLTNADAFNGDDLESIDRLAQLDSLRGLFRQYHLRNIRSLFVAIGKGRISPRDIFNYVSHSRKMIAKFEFNPMNTKFTIWAHYDHPGLMLTLLRVLGWVPGSGLTVVQSKVDRFNPPENAPAARLAFHVDIPGIGVEDLRRIEMMIKKIADIGASNRAWGALQRIVRPVHNWLAGMTTVRVRVRFPERKRQMAEESPPTLLARAVIKLDPHNNITSFHLEPDGHGGSIVIMDIEILHSLKPRLLDQLTLAVGLPESYASFIKNNDGEPEDVFPGVALEGRILLTRIGIQNLSELYTNWNFRTLATQIDENSEAQSLESSYYHGAVERTVEEFKKWLAGEKVSETIAQAFVDYAVSSTRIKGKINGIGEPSYFGLLAHELRQQGRSVNFQEWPQPYPSHASPSDFFSLQTTSESPTEPQLGIEVVDSKDDAPSGVHFFRVRPLNGKPRFKVFVQARYLAEGRAKEIISRVIEATDAAVHTQAIHYPKVLIDPQLSQQRHTNLSIVGGLRARLVTLWKRIRRFRSVFPTARSERRVMHAQA
jgi:hypothetical protein